MDVELSPPAWATHLISDLDDWMRAPRPVASVAPFCLPDAAYFEYAWLDARGERRADPANPQPGRNPWWPYARWLAGPSYRPDRWAEIPEPTAPAGRVQRLRVPSSCLGQTRHLLVYSPAGHQHTALPHVWFQDGKAYFAWGRAPQVLDRMLAAGRCAPAHLVFVPPQDRSREYLFNDRYLAFLTDEALPLVETSAPCDGRRVAWGASLGGLCSAELAWRYPLRFQSVVTQSGAFLFHPGTGAGVDPYTGRPWWRDRVEREVWRPLRWHLQTGTLEWLHRPNEMLASALVSADFDVQYQERVSGHNWTTWRDGLAAALRWALPLPA